MGAPSFKQNEFDFENQLKVIGWIKAVSTKTNSYVPTYIRIGLTLAAIGLFAGFMAWSDNAIPEDANQVEKFVDFSSSLASLFIPPLIAIWLVPLIVKSLSPEQRASTDTIRSFGDQKPKDNHKLKLLAARCLQFSGMVVVLGGLWAGREISNAVEKLPPPVLPAETRLWAALNVTTGILEIIGALMIATGLALTWKCKRKRI